MSKIVTPSSPALTVYNFDEYLNAIRQEALSSGMVVIDLRPLQFIDLFSILGILYCCEDLCHIHKCRVRLEMEHGGACSYLPRIGFFRVLSGDVERSDVFTPNYLEFVAAYQGSNKEVVELTPIETHESLRLLPTHLIDVLRRRMKYPKHDAYDLGIVFSELCNNVLDHNASAVSGLAAMQVFHGKDGKFIEIVVGDRGDGIRRTLERNPQNRPFKRDIEAIERSLDLGVSEHQDSTRGTGLPHLVSLTLKHKGSIHIRSGTGKLYIRGDRRSINRFNVPHMTGSQFAITLPALDRP
jgi:anti-sigma regulatory factor (Ser/Thr protein kinase)